MNDIQDDHGTSFDDVKQFGLIAAIGWTPEGKLGPTMYDHLASRDRFSRELLVERMEAGETSIPAATELDRLAANTDVSADELIRLYNDDATGSVDTIPHGEEFDWLVAFTGDAPRALTDLLYATHTIGLVWYIMGGIGIVSALGIWQYGRWILTLYKTD